MGDWVPSKNFDDEISDMQPDCDLIFENYGKDPFNLFGDDSRSSLNSNEQSNGNEIRDDKKELIVAARAHRLLQKQGNIVVGKLYGKDDLDEVDSVERETIAMIRDSGSEFVTESTLDSKRTIATVQSSDPVIYNKKLPILLHESYFKLKPRNSSNSNSNSTLDSSSESLSSHGYSGRLKTIYNDTDDNSSNNIESDFPYGKLTADNNKTPSVNTSSSSNYQTALNSPIATQTKTDTEENKNNKILYRNTQFYTPRELYAMKRLNKNS